MSPPHRWRRGDGTVLSCTDLTQAVPMMPDELDDLVRLADLVEEWLRFDDAAADLLTDWLTTTGHAPGNRSAAQAVIDEFGTLSVRLHRILHAGVPATGHTHPPTA
jgi:hypothetical protein